MEDRDLAGADAEGSRCSPDRFVIRAYLPGDEQKINDMFNEVFSQQRELAHWYWKYRDNPLGAHYISMAVSEDGMLAAHYAGYPVLVYVKPDDRHDPQELLSLQLGDKMTRRRFRGVGFRRGSLMARTYDHFRNTFTAGRMPFCYGFATHHSLRLGVVVLGYADIEPVLYRTLPLSAPKRGYLDRLTRTFSGRRVSEVTVIDGEWTDFFYQVAPSYHCLLKRDADFLTWRYLRRPDRQYLVVKVTRGKRLTGWSVFYPDGERVLWGDALFSPGDEESVKAVVRYVRECPRTASAERIEGWFSQRPAWWDATLKQLGFGMSPEPNQLRLTSPIVNDAGAPSLLGTHFYYTWGDSDLF